MSFRWIAEVFRAWRSGSAGGRRSGTGLVDAPDPDLLRSIGSLRDLPAADRSGFEGVRKLGEEVRRERSIVRARELISWPMPSRSSADPTGRRVHLERAALKGELERLRNAGEIEERRFAEAMVAWERVLSTIASAGDRAPSPYARRDAEELLRRAVLILDSIARRPIAELRRAEPRFEHAWRQWMGGR